MPSHAHMIIGTKGEKMQNVIRDLKKFTSKGIIEAIKDNPTESRREWMFERVGSKMGKIRSINFGKSKISQ